MSEPAKVLIVDDEEEMLGSCVRLLGRTGYRCLTTTDPAHALALIEDQRPDVILTDLKMPGYDGMDVLRRARELDPEAVVLIFTAHATIESAVAAIKEGAYDYIPKPFEAEDLRQRLARALEKRRLIRENRNLRTQIETTYGFENIVGKSQAMAHVFELVKKAARSEANILIRGESGTGKELIARAIHAQSPRAREAFVPLDCASLPEPLLESELFGHERGAFTGAVRTKLGMFEVAHRGTIFLDEIRDLPLSLQAKLLRVLQERQVRRVGGTKMIDVDVRLVSSTNQDLAEAVKQGAFREDLFYRVHVIAIALPPLRERTGDIPLVAYHFLRRYNRSRETAVEEISPEALAFLESYTWPGNVRELQNVIERACVLAEGPRLEARDLPQSVRGASGGRPTLPRLGGKDLPMKVAKEEWLQTFEREYLMELLHRHGGNVSQAAKVAQIDRKTIHRLIKKYRLKFRGES